MRIVGRVVGGYVRKRGFQGPLLIGDGFGVFEKRIDLIDVERHLQ